MEGNRKVIVSQGPSLQAVLVRGGFAPSWGVMPMGEQWQVLQDGSGTGALPATLWLRSLCWTEGTPGQGQSRACTASCQYPEKPEGKMC